MLSFRSFAVRNIPTRSLCNIKSSLELAVFNVALLREAFSEAIPLYGGLLHLVAVRVFAHSRSCVLWLPWLIPTFHLGPHPAPARLFLPYAFVRPLFFVRGSPGRVLRGQPFFGTRRQQLSYRVMLVQGFLVAVLFAATVGVDAFYVVGHLLRQQAVPRASTGFTVVSVSHLPRCGFLLVGPSWCQVRSTVSLWCHHLRPLYPSEAQLEGTMAPVSAERIV